MYKCKIIKSKNYFQSDLNAFLNSLGDKKIISIQFAYEVEGSSHGGYGDTISVPSALVVWEE